MPEVMVKPQSLPKLDILSKFLGEISPLLRYLSLLQDAVADLQLFDLKERNPYCASGRGLFQTNPAVFPRFLERNAPRAADFSAVILFRRPVIFRTNPGSRPQSACCMLPCGLGGLIRGFFFPLFSPPFLKKQQTRIK